MSVLIRGMEMPKNCEDCPMAFSVNFGILCTPTHNIVGDGEISKKQNWCPLVEVWIPVSEKLPQKCKFYLVTDCGEVEEAYYNSDGFWFSWNGNKLKSVTHWMTLPEPPKDGE